MQDSFQYNYFKILWLVVIVFGMLLIYKNYLFDKAGCNYRDRDHYEYSISPGYDERFVSGDKETLCRLSYLSSTKYYYDRTGSTTNFILLLIFALPVHWDIYNYTGLLFVIFGGIAFLYNFAKNAPLPNSELFNN